MRLQNCVWIVSADPKISSFLSESLSRQDYQLVVTPSLADDSIKEKPAPDLVLFDVDSSGGKFLDVE
jgi:DNA-binding response OmpR family regulator